VLIEVGPSQVIEFMSLFWGGGGWWWVGSDQDN